MCEFRSRFSFENNVEFFLGEEYFWQYILVVIYIGDGYMYGRWLHVWAMLVCCFGGPASKGIF